MKNFKPGDVIKVKVDGVEYDTIIDKDNVQRFRQNEVVRFIVGTGAGQISLNQLAIDYQRGANPPFSERAFAEFNMMLGYSVCGFADLSFFENMEIENPLWEDDCSPKEETKSAKEWDW